MFLAELFAEAAQPQLVVFYPGRFQPFHLGHRDVFASLQAKFGRDAVYIATSNKVELPKSPFNFSEKTAFMNAAGVGSDRIIEVAYSDYNHFFLNTCHGHLLISIIY